MSNTSKREQLIQAALTLFCEKGFHAVGTDAIAQHSGVTKKTMYHHFKSKDELILAVLRYYDERFRNDFMRAVEGKAETPRERLLAVFDVAEKWFAKDNFYGCLFVAAAGEYPEPDTPIRHTCKEFKGLMQKYIEGLATQAGAESPEQLASHLLLLLEGAITLAQIHASPQTASQAKEAAKVLIQDAIKR